MCVFCLSRAVWRVLRTNDAIGARRRAPQTQKDGGYGKHERTCMRVCSWSERSVFFSSLGASSTPGDTDCKRGIKLEVYVEGVESSNSDLFVLRIQ